MLARQNSVSVNISRNNGRARDCVLEGRGRTGDWYILRNCWDYERGVSFLGNVLGARRKKVRPVCSTISGELRAAMSPGYVPWYTERSLSRRCISRDAARPGHLTYKMVSVFQLSRDKLWIMGVNTKQPVVFSSKISRTLLPPPSSSSSFSFILLRSKMPNAIDNLVKSRNEKIAYIYVKNLYYQEIF